MFSKLQSKFNKYARVVSATWMSGFAYPLSFWMWRLRQVMSIVIAISLWQSIFAASSNVFGYDQAQMLTYIFISNIAGFIVLSSRTIEVPSVITSGDLSLYLLKPVHFFAYWFSRDIADKTQNAMFSCVELLTLFLIYRPHLTIPAHLSTALLAFLAIGGGVVLYFFINMLFGFMAFWVPDVWAPRFLFFIIMFFLSGSTFPLDIYPKQLVDALSYTPFPYLIFFPAKVWLEQLSFNQIVTGFGALFGWILAFGILTSWIWSRAIKGYGADGR